MLMDLFQHGEHAYDRRFGKGKVLSFLILIFFLSIYTRDLFQAAELVTDKLTHYVVHMKEMRDYLEIRLAVSNF